jgi:hypothetical protein
VAQILFANAKKLRFVFWLQASYFIAIRRVRRHSSNVDMFQHINANLMGLIIVIRSVG